MATPATLQTLITGSKCFNCLSSSERQAALVVFLALALKAAGGTDYTNVNTLRSASSCMNCPPNSELESFDVEIAQTLANNLGASANLTIAQLKASTAKMVSWGPTDLHGAQTFLRNQLAALNI